MRKNWRAVLCVGLAIIIFAGLAQAIISATYAKLPDITAAELIKAVKFGDSLHINVDCKYTVDEQFIKGLYGDWMPEKRKLEIHWRKEGIREYTDTTCYDGSRNQPKMEDNLFTSSKAYLQKLYDYSIFVTAYPARRYNLRHLRPKRFCQW